MPAIKGPPTKLVPLTLDQLADRLEGLIKSTAPQLVPNWMEFRACVEKTLPPAPVAAAAPPPPAPPAPGVPPPPPPAPVLSHADKIKAALGN